MQIINVTYTENRDSRVWVDPREHDVGPVHPSSRRETNPHVSESLHLWIFNYKSLNTCRKYGMTMTCTSVKMNIHICCHILPHLKLHYNLVIFWLPVDGKLSILVKVEPVCPLERLRCWANSVLTCE